MRGLIPQEVIERRIYMVLQNSCHPKLFEYSISGDFGMSVFSKASIGEDRISQERRLFHKTGQLFHIMAQGAVSC